MRGSSARRGFGAAFTRAALVAGAALCVPVGARALFAQSSLGVHGVDVRPAGSSRSARALFVDLRLDRSAQMGDWELRVEGEAWIDARRPDASLLAPGEVGLSRSWENARLRIGVGNPAWGLSTQRSPVAAFAPKAVLWNALEGPPLGGPKLELSLFRDWGDLDFVLLPFRRPFYASRLVRRTWDGREVEDSGEWDAATDYGIRFWRSFRAVDFAVSWIDGADRRGWVVEGGAGPEFDRPRTRQVGWELELAADEMVLRSEGGIGRREGNWDARALAGVEWFATPYLTLLLEQGLAGDADVAEPPLVDDTVVGAEVVTERLRLRAGIATDLRTGTLHHWSAARWTLGPRGALELEWIGSRGDAADSPPLAMRQPRALRLGSAWYF